MRADSLRKRLLPAGLVVSTGLVVLLAVQYRRLEDSYGRLSQHLTSLPVGSFVPTLHAPSPAGDSATIAGPGHREILLYLTTTCQYCAGSLPAWRRLMQRARELKNVRILAVSMDSADATDAYLKANGFAEVDAVLLLERRLRFLFRSTSVPQTLVIADGGRVVYSRPEQFTFAAADSLINLLLAMDAERAAGIEGEDGFH